jgi:hypothetical protein
VVVDFIREHANHQEPGGLRWGVESICSALIEHCLPIASSTYYEWTDRLPTGRQRRDAALPVEIRRVFMTQPIVLGEPTIIRDYASVMKQMEAAHRKSHVRGWPDSNSHAHRHAAGGISV